MRNLFRVIWHTITAPFRWFGRTLGEVRNFLTEEPEDTPIGDSFQKAVENPNEILFHLNDLRKHIFRAVAFLGIATIISFAFTNHR